MKLFKTYSMKIKTLLDLLTSIAAFFICFEIDSNQKYPNFN